MSRIQSLEQRIQELEELLEHSERKSDILTNLLKEATAEFNQVLEKVSTSEANFRAIIENAPEAIYILDLGNHRILDCNPFTTRWLGYPRPELLQMGIEQILTPGAEGVIENIRKAAAEGVVHIQERSFQKKDGSLVDAEVTGMVVEVQGKKCFVALARDVTERKKNEGLLRYKELFDNVIDPVFISHSQGAFLEVNDVACLRLQYPRQQLLKLTFTDIVRPTQLKVLRRMGEKVRSGETVQFEIETVTQSGEVIPFEFHSRLIDFQRKPAVLSVARDLSARKRMEEKLIRSERLSAVGEMASGVAHNFNNLLQMILGGGEAALKKLASGEIRKSREAILTLMEACHRGADIVRRIKEFTAAKNEGLDKAKVFDLGDLVSEAVQLTASLWANPANPGKYRLNYIRPLGGLIRGNPSELYEVLVNLIKNALEAMPEGGTLTISPEARQEHIYLSITDTGKGISEENRQRLFQPFFTTKGEKSSGLGLSSSYGIIKKHGGDMVVKSEPGAGATFTIILPRAGTLAEEEQSQTLADRTPAETKIKFLLIDDEKNILKMMEMFFEDSPVELTTAGTTERGLAAIYGDRFDAILCDFGMDGMNGLELGRAAWDYARQTGWPKTPFLLYTGVDKKLDPEELSRCGVDWVVRKPIACTELLRILYKIHQEHQTSGLC
ncbi:MAG: PAS domain S-box protein [Deltaproteobacteria bacterium]|nr:PAS domain S-box protein [Deltaproteobacteria bacterium]